MAPSSTGMLVKWDVPFRDTLNPSVSVITQEGGQRLVLAVAPGGIDRYPKFIVRFSVVVAFLSLEEAGCPEREYPVLSIDNRQFCAFHWLDSPWLQSYRAMSDVFGWEMLKHYVIFGGDSIVEVVSAADPSVERIESNVVIEGSYEA